MALLSRDARQFARQTQKIHSRFADRPIRPLVCKDRDRRVPKDETDEAGWSFAALLSVFAASLVRWMVVLGVHPADVEDATQEALVEAWQRASTLPVGQDEAQHEMFRIAAKMAQRSRRHAARLVCVDELVPHRREDDWFDR